MFLRSHQHVQVICNVNWYDVIKLYSLNLYFIDTQSRQSLVRKFETKDLPKNWEVAGSGKSIITQKVPINTFDADGIEMLIFVWPRITDTII